MEIFTIIKVATQKDGPGVVATTEKAFTTAKQAQDFMTKVPTVWDEMIMGMECSCERAIHSTTLE